MKVKTFICSDLNYIDKFDEKINTWIDSMENKIHIINQTTSAVGTQYYSGRTIITQIWYKEIES
jgi:hypothetical protein